MAASAAPVLNPGIFPLKALWCGPPGVASADCGQVCRCDDGCDYVIKDGVSKSSTPLVPHSEWLCSQLGELVGIAAPPHKVIDMRDGTLAFGSRWSGGVVRPDTPGGWVERVRTKAIDLDDIKDALSRIYAFDQFVSNVDRHRGNFIVHDQHAGLAVLANDYSRAWARQGFPLPDAPLPACNTVSEQRNLKILWGAEYIMPDTVDEFLNKLSQITKAQVERIIDDHLSIWLPVNLKRDILTWWDSSDRTDRINGIARGVRDGSYL